MTDLQLSSLFINQLLMMGLPAIDDSLMRQIMTYRYIDGDTWQMIAARIGEWDEQYPRRLHNRYLAGHALPACVEFDENDEADAL